MGSLNASRLRRGALTRDGTDDDDGVEPGSGGAKNGEPRPRYGYVAKLDRGENKLEECAGTRFISGRKLSNLSSSTSDIPSAALAKVYG